MTACGRLPASTAGLFGPDSVTWKIDREVVVLASGPRALLMQVAHPLVAAAVAEHSRFRVEPIARLYGTLRAIYSFAFDDAEQAARIVAGVDRVHAGVRGTTTEGTSYSALDPHLKLWVYATLIDSSLLAYESFVAPLRAAERESYYAEFQRAGRFWGIPANEFPSDLAGLRAWMADMIASGEVSVGPLGRAVAHDILYPPVKWVPAPALLPLRLFATWLLPPPLREGFGLSWGRRREALMQRCAAASRRVVPNLPGVVRDLPIARAAERRVRSSG